MVASPGAARPVCEAPLGGGTSAVLPTLTDNHGFVVVGRNSVGEGSFGEESEPHERPSPESGDVCP